jgi:hypothetical protein
MGSSFMRVGFILFMWCFAGGLCIVFIGPLSIFFFNVRTQYQHLGDLVINRELLRSASMYGSVNLRNGGVTNPM